MKITILSFLLLASISSNAMHEQDGFNLYSDAVIKLQTLQKRQDNDSQLAFQEFGHNIALGYKISDSSKNILTRLDLLDQMGNVKDILCLEFIRRIPQNSNN